jgi:hypothetical protein
MARQRAGLWTPTNRGRKCSHRISGRPVRDQLFFRRVLARLQNPDHDNRLQEQPRPKMQPSHFRSFFAGFVWHPAIVSDVLQIGRSQKRGSKRTRIKGIDA